MNLTTLESKKNDLKMQLFDIENQIQKYQNDLNILTNKKFMLQGAYNNTLELIANEKQHIEKWKQKQSDDIREATKSGKQSSKPKKT